MMFPKDISGTFWAIADRATDVSGREVPIAISVDPIIRGETLILEDNLSTNFNSRFAEMTKRPSEPKNSI